MRTVRFFPAPAPSIDRSPAENTYAQFCPSTIAAAGQ